MAMRAQDMRAQQLNEIAPPVARPSRPALHRRAVAEIFFLIVPFADLDRHFIENLESTFTLLGDEFMKTLCNINHKGNREIKQIYVYLKYITRSLNVSSLLFGN